MQITTGQMRDRKRLEAGGWECIDVTVKSGLAVFAPTWSMVMGYKNGVLSEGEYTQRYGRMMRKSLLENTSEWLGILRKEKVALLCYCSSGSFCHRHLLKGYLLKVGEKKGIPVEIIEEKGNIPPREKETGR